MFYYDLTGYYKSAYKAMGFALALLSIVVGALSLKHNVEDQVETILKQASAVCVFCALVLIYRFFFGKKRGNIILFIFKIVVLLITFECYIGVYGNLPLHLGLIMTSLLAISMLGMASYLKLMPDLDYFEKYFDKIQS